VQSRPATKKGEATRQRILDAASEAMIEGEGHIELSDVAQRAQVTQSLIHRYFGTKSGLVSVIIEDFYSRLRHEVLTAALTELGSWARRERFRVELGIRFHLADPIAAVIYGKLSRDPAVAAAEARFVEDIVEHAAANIRRGQEAGEISADVDPRLAGAAMFGSLRQMYIELHSRPEPPDFDVIAEAHWRQVAAAVRLDTIVPQH
jgi:AcrR family transcriptional regulator